MTTVVESGNNYLRLSDGTQVCWGEFAKKQNVEVTVALPFIDTNWKVITQHIGTMRGNYTNTSSIKSQTTTMFTFDTNHSEQDTYHYVAIGRWK